MDLLDVSIGERYAIKIKGRIMTGKAEQVVPGGNPGPRVIMSGLVFEDGISSGWKNGADSILVAKLFKL